MGEDKRTDETSSEINTSASPENGNAGGGKKPLKEKVKSFCRHIKYYWNKPLGADRHLPIKEMAAYGVGGMGCNFIINLTSLILSATLIPRYYEIPALHGTLIVAIASFMQIFLCPLVGRWMDKTHTKMGKYKPYFLYLTPIFTVFVVLASWIPQFAGADKALLYRTIFAYGTCIPALFLLGIYQNLFQSYSMLMTPNSQERADMMAPVTLLYSFAPTIMGPIIQLMRGAFIKKGMEFMAFRISGLVFGLLGCAMVSLIIFFTKERVYITNRNEKGAGFLKSLKALSKNRPFIMYLVFMAFSILKITAFNFMAIMAEYKFNPDPSKAIAIYSGLMLVMGFGATPGMILAPILMRKIPKKWLLIGAHLLQAVTLFALVVAGFERFPQGIASVLIITAYGFLFQFGNGVSLVVMPTMVAETVDYQQYLSDERMEGFMNNLTVLVSTGIGNLLVIAVTLIQTQVVGFDQGLPYFIPSSPEFGGAAAAALSNKWFNIACIISIASLVLCSIPLIFFNLDTKRHKDIMDVIKSRAEKSTFEDEEALTRDLSGERLAEEIAEINESMK